MVCSVGSDRMAVMVRLLEAGRISPNITEEVGYKKLAAQYIYRELHGADEANLLDEEGNADVVTYMHVFGLKPMADPLHLVCCNACKKPVKTSQYAAHAELCRSLKTRGDAVLELDGSTGHRKPPRKERKKALAACANQPTPIGELERSEIIDSNDTTASEHVGGQIGTTSSLTMDAKRNSTYVDVPFLIDGSRVSPNNTHQLISLVPPSTKRFKLKGGVCLPLPHDLKTVSGEAKIPKTHDLYASRNSPRQTVSGSETADDRPDHKECLLKRDPPVPLSTKIYYSQRSSRLRLVLSHQYFVTSTKQICSDMEPDQNFSQSSEVCMSKPVGCLPSNDFSNQRPIDNISRSQAASVGMTRNKYVSQPYSFAGNSGKVLGPMQPPNGSVPVV